MDKKKSKKKRKKKQSDGDFPTIRYKKIITPYLRMILKKALYSHFDLSFCKEYPAFCTNMGKLCSSLGHLR